ncbi:MAG: hypothetical protein IT374_13650 [Polyangiaceae bacterium]|nr:hypothetical protein [Polyangiaceae bacterium]
MSAPSRAACAALALVASSGLAAAARAIVTDPFGRRAPPQLAPAPVGREVQAARGVAVAGLPEIAPPPHLRQADVQGKVGVDAVELKVGDARTARRAGASVPLSVETAHPASVMVGERSTTGAGFAVESGALRCETASPRAPIRWETLAEQPDGTAVWTVGDGYADGARCEAKQLSRVELRLARVAGLGVPVYAARTADGVMVFTPRAVQATGDTSVGRIGALRAPVTRVFLPTRRGESASVLLNLDVGRLEDWVRRVGGPALAERPLRATVRLDVSQTVSEATPTLFVSSALTLPEPPPKAR